MVYKLAGIDRVLRMKYDPAHDLTQQSTPSRSSTRRHLRINISLHMPAATATALHLHRCRHAHACISCSAQLERYGLRSASRHV